MSEPSDEEYGTPRNSLISKEDETDSLDDFKSTRDNQKSVSLSDFGLEDEELHPWDSQHEAHEEDKKPPLNVQALLDSIAEPNASTELKRAKKGLTLRNLFRKTDKSQSGDPVFLLKSKSMEPENYIRANIISKNQSTQGYSLQDIDGNKYENIPETRFMNVSEFIKLLKRYPESNIDGLFGRNYPDVNLNDPYNFETISNYLYKSYTNLHLRGKTRKLFSKILPIEREGSPTRELIVYVMREIEQGPQQQSLKAGEKDSRYAVWDRGQLLSIEKVTINGQIVLKYKIKLDISPKVKIFYNRQFMDEKYNRIEGSQIINEKQYYEYIMRTAEAEAGDSYQKPSASSNSNYASDFGAEGGKRKRTRRRKTYGKKHKTQKMRAISRKGKKRTRKGKTNKK
jgi:hypothetical protein